MSKTILISLASNITVGNFTMPKGVLELLSERSKKDGFKLVFLTSLAFHDKLGCYAETGDVIFEEIAKYPPRGLIQKAFFFFYSYLIFTGTTRLLSTFGARADSPPAGGNRHLSILKLAIANTFGRFKHIKRKFVPFLYKKIFRERPYKKFFERYQPDLLFVPNIAFFPDIELVAEAKRQGVNTVGMAQNWDHLNKYFIPQHADILLVQNAPMKREAMELHAYKENEIKLVGFPQFDLYADAENYVYTREEFESEFKIPPNKKIILHISGSVYAPDESDILNGIADWIEGDLLDYSSHLLVRPYVAKRDLKNEQVKYGALMKRKEASFNWQLTERSREGIKRYVSMLYYSDVVLSVFSTTAIEAAIFDKPTIIIGFDGHKKREAHTSVKRLEKLAHFKHVLETDGVSVARGFAELQTMVNSALHDPSFGSEAREHLAKKMCYSADGRAAERVVEEIVGEL